jgi:hypothetical protein
MEEELTFDPALFFDNVEVLGDISSGLVKVDTLTPNSKDFIAVGNGVTVSKAGLVVGVVTAISGFNAAGERTNGMYYDLTSSSQEVRFQGSLLPTVHNAFDLGSAEYKVRDVYEDPGSDERIKEDIVPFTGALNFVNQIPVVSFTFKDIEYNEHTRGKRETGFIAQDVKKALDNSDYESYRLWSENPESYQGLDKKQMIPALTAAIQELSKKIDAIEERLDKLA